MGGDDWRGGPDPLGPFKGGQRDRVAAIKAGAWVSSTTHSCEYRPSSLPGNIRGDGTPFDPQSIDLSSMGLVVTRPLTVKLLPKQPGPVHALQAAAPSDEVSELAIGSHLRRGRCERGRGVAHGGHLELRRPALLCQFFEGPANGFDWQPEPERLDNIEKHVRVLLQAASVVGLQEVPATLVPRLAALGAAPDFQVQWVTAPSLEDKALYKKAVGRGGCSTSMPCENAEVEEPSVLLNGLPQVAHDMLLCKYSSLKAGVPALAGSLAEALTKQSVTSSVAAAERQQEAAPVGVAEDCEERSEAGAVVADSCGRTCLD